MSNTPFEIAAISSVQQSVADNTVTGLALDTITYSKNAGTITSIAGQIIVPFSGFYELYFSIGVTAAAAGVYNAYLTINSGTEEYGNDGVNAASTQRIDMVCVVPKRFAAGDILKLNLLQVTGGAINMGNAANNRAKLSIIKISD